MMEIGFAIAILLTAMVRRLEGTLVEVASATPQALTIRAESQFQTFEAGSGVMVERESSLADRAAATTTKIELADLTPGEFVRIEIDAQGHVRHAHATARIERARVRSAKGKTVVLENGTTLTIGPLLRFVNESGRPSATSALRPGESVILFHHPQTGNIYRFSADRPVRKHRSKPGKGGDSK